MVDTIKSWTWEEIKEVRELAANGWSALDISRKLVGRTRNSVIGVCHRRGIHLQSKNGRMMAEAKALLPQVPKRVRPSRAKPKTLGPRLDVLPKAYIIKKITPVEDENFTPLNVTIVDLRHFHCRAVVSEIKAGDTFYCGHEAITGKSWCPYHMLKYTYPLIKRAG